MERGKWLVVVKKVFKSGNFFGRRLFENTNDISYLMLYSVLTQLNHINKREKGKMTSCNHESINEWVLYWKENIWKYQWLFLLISVLTQWNHIKNEEKWLVVVKNVLKSG